MTRGNLPLHPCAGPISRQMPQNLNKIKYRCKTKQPTHRNVQLERQKKLWWDVEEKHTQLENKKHCCQSFASLLHMISSPRKTADEPIDASNWTDWQLHRCDINRPLEGRQLGRSFQYKWRTIWDHYYRIIIESMTVCSTKIRRSWSRKFITCFLGEDWVGDTTLH